MLSLYLLWRDITGCGHGIYHNVALRAPLKSAQGDFGAKPMKTPAYQAKNPQNGTDES